ncbi:MAG: thioredoxin [Blastocatellia bacterium]|nr:thioredoxin [Blastocatellia bacterium]MBL8192607.1 thioredoxin [Blastocatellia bacterium]
MFNPTQKHLSQIQCVHCGAKNKIDATKLAQHLRPICGKCQQALSTSPAQVVKVTDANFVDTVGKSHLPVLLDLWAAWCGPCRMLSPTIDQIAQELAGQVKVAKLNVDENPLTAAKFNARSIPTLLILKNGQEIARIVGAQPKQEILRQLSKVL